MWYGANIGGTRVSNLTFDLNTPATPVAPTMLLYFAAHNTNINGGSFDHLNVINGTGFMYLLYAEAANGSLRNFHMDDNYLHIAAPDSVHGNQCAATSMQAANSLITDITIDRNICVNTGIQLDAVNSSVSFNDISGYGFGTAIFSPYWTSNHLMVVGNRMHDSALTRDSNNVLAGGMEAVDNSVICENMFYNLGGAAINNFGKNSLICNNVAYNNGSSPLAVAASPEQAAFHTIILGGHKFGENTRYVGNQAWDDRVTPKQLYGYFDYAGDAVTGITFSGNNFHGYLSGKAYAINQGTNPDPNVEIMLDWVTLGTAYEYRVSEIAFTGIDPSYTQFKLNCGGIGPYPAGTVKVQFGTGAGPTWISGATDYLTGGSQTGFTVGAVATTTFNTNSNGMDITATQWAPAYSQTSNNMLTAHFAAIGGTTVDTFNMRFETAFLANTGAYASASGASATGVVANPITAIRILSEDAGAISGNCRLQGTL
jgi:hypothetical protein